MLYNTGCTAGTGVDRICVHKTLFKFTSHYLDWRHTQIDSYVVPQIGAIGSVRCDIQYVLPLVSSKYPDQLYQAGGCIIDASLPVSGTWEVFVANVSAGVFTVERIHPPIITNISSIDVSRIRSSDLSSVVFVYSGEQLQLDGNYFPLANYSSFSFKSTSDSFGSKPTCETISNTTCRISCTVTTSGVWEIQLTNSLRGQHQSDDYFDKTVRCYSPIASHVPVTIKSISGCSDYCPLGSVLTIHGTNFDSLKENNSVSFTAITGTSVGTQPECLLIFSSGEMLKCTLRNNTEDTGGNWSLQVTRGGGSVGSFITPFVPYVTPVVLPIVIHHSGSVVVGDVISITGKKFDGKTSRNSVLFEKTLQSSGSTPTCEILNSNPVFISCRVSSSDYSTSGSWKLVISTAIGATTSHITVVVKQRPILFDIIVSDNCRYSSLEKRFWCPFRSSLQLHGANIRNSVQLIAFKNGIGSTPTCGTNGVHFVSESLVLCDALIKNDLVEGSWEIVLGGQQSKQIILYNNLTIPEVSNKPSVIKIIPKEVVAGQLITIVGSNFDYISSSNTITVSDNSSKQIPFDVAKCLVEKEMFPPSRVKIICRLLLNISKEYDYENATDSNPVISLIVHSGNLSSNSFLVRWYDNTPTLTRTLGADYYHSTRTVTETLLVPPTSIPTAVPTEGPQTPVPASYISELVIVVFQTQLSDFNVTNFKSVVAKSLNTATDSILISAIYESSVTVEFHFISFDHHFLVVGFVAQMTDSSSEIIKSLPPVVSLSYTEPVLPSPGTSKGIFIVVVVAVLSVLVVAVLVVFAFCRYRRHQKLKFLTKRSDEPDSPSDSVDDGDLRMLENKNRSPHKTEQQDNQQMVFESPAEDTCNIASKPAQSLSFSEYSATGPLEHHHPEKSDDGVLVCIYLIIL